MKIQDVWFVLSFMALLLFVIFALGLCFPIFPKVMHLPGPPSYAGNVLYLPLEQHGFELFICPLMCRFFS